MESFFTNFGIESTYMDTCNPKDVENAIKPNTKLIYLETLMKQKAA
jgi:O-acetylhomoserine/O-acetylserine sulfhydrylase-like pyridoxal-dependent enzyme